jgi:hypothetical protein
MQDLPHVFCLFMALISLTIFAGTLLMFSLFDDKAIGYWKIALSYIFIACCLIVMLLCVDTIDYTGYKDMYITGVESLTNYSGDILFNGLIMLHRKYVNNFHAFYLTVGIINMCLLLFILNSVNANQRIVFCIVYFSFFFLLKDCIQIRNALAVKIALISIIFFLRKRHASFLITYLMSIFVHNSMLVFLPCFFLYKKRLSKGLMCLLIMLFFISYFWFKGIYHLFPISPVLGRLEGYVGIKLDSLSMFHFFKFVFYFFVFSICQSEYDQKTMFFFWCVVFAYMIRIFLSDIPFLGGRLAENLYIGEVFLLSCLVNAKWSRKKKILIRVFLLVYLILNINMLFKNLNLIYAYKTLQF